jgi:uncharacterized phage protein (TIGR02218 family)
MRDIAPALAERLAAGATTLATVWIVRRRDGVVFGFTDHDRPLVVGGVACDPDTGFDRSAASRNADLSVGEEEVSGALTSEAITEADIAAGLWDGADVEVRLVDWSVPDLGLMLRQGTLGEITAADGVFRAELRGPAHKLDQPVGRLYGRDCDATFCDGRCGLTASDWTAGATVGPGSDDRVLFVVGLPETDAGWFAGGLLIVAGVEIAIEAHLADELGARLTLAGRLASVPEEGTAVQLVAGCDKHFTTCRDRFANEENFRGFPHLPGRDFVFSYARNDGKDAGEVLF